MSDVLGWKYNTIRKPDHGKPIMLVVGGQWGSEAKGMVAAALCQRYGIDYAVRTGGVNAGHTVYFGGKPFKMQQLPTGWVNPKTRLVLGPGAYINPFILRDEIQMIDSITADKKSNTHESLWTRQRLYIDPRAGVHLPTHTDKSKVSGRHHAIGATGKGCSEAVMDRIRMRGTDVRPIFGTGEAFRGGEDVGDFFNWMPADVEYLLNSAYDGGARILLEATQGQMLDLLLGPWPYTTHKPTSPAQWLVECGLSPKLKYEVVMVARTYPIRVAGNSGSMPNEISWEEFGHETGLVNDNHLDIWRCQCKELAQEWQEKKVLPRYTDTGRPNADFQWWSADMREQYQFAVSEFHAEVIKRMERTYPEVLKELLKVFELTTVTKKLRRIARWDHQSMAASVRQIRPDYMVLTFLNYEFPELWGKTEIHEKAMKFIRHREKELGVWIRYVTTGPESQHLIPVDEGC